MKPRTGRPATYTFRFAPDYHHAPRRLEHWAALSPMGRVAQALALAARRSEPTSIAQLAADARIDGTKDVVRTYLAGAEALDFIAIKDRERGRKEVLVLTCPPCERPDLAAGALERLGLDLYPPRAYLRERAAPAFTYWLRLCRRVTKREYQAPRAAHDPKTGKREKSSLAVELNILSELIGDLIAASGHSDRHVLRRVADLMLLFQRKVLDVERHQLYRRHGPTLTTFCRLYPRLAKQADKAGFGRLTREERAVLARGVGTARLKNVGLQRRREEADRRIEQTRRNDRFERELSWNLDKAERTKWKHLDDDQSE